MSEARVPYGDEEAAGLALLREMVQAYGAKATELSIFGRPVEQLLQIELRAALAMLIEHPELAANQAVVQRRHRGI